MVLEKTLESPLDCKEIQLIHPKGNQSWMFIGRIDVEAETLTLWPPDIKSWLIWKDPDAGKYWKQEEKETTEDEVIEWHNWLNGHEFEWTGNWWWTGRPGVLRFMGSRRVGHDWVTELNWKIVIWHCSSVRSYKIVTINFGFCEQYRHNIGKWHYRIKIQKLEKNRTHNLIRDTQY